MLGGMNLRASPYRGRKGKASEYRGLARVEGVNYNKDHTFFQSELLYERHGRGQGIDISATFDLKTLGMAHAILCYCTFNRNLRIT